MLRTPLETASAVAIHCIATTRLAVRREAMASKKRKARSPTTRVRVPDEELIARLEEHAPEVLTATIPEVVFDATVRELLKESPSHEMPHFYCRKCGEYHLKSHQHYLR
jgi:formylmethanofuran dehydrogenase subunit E